MTRESLQEVILTLDLDEMRSISGGLGRFPRVSRNGQALDIPSQNPRVLSSVIPCIIITPQTFPSRQYEALGCWGSRPRCQSPRQS